MLAFRGHFLTKSPAYSTTFNAIRGDRRAFRLAETLERLGLTEQADSIAVVNDWRFDGAGYRDDAERELAAGIAEHIREDRKHKYSKETTLNDRLLSIEDLSAHFQVPVNTLYQWRKTGKGLTGFRAGKYVRYRASDVEAWITEQATV